MSRNKKILLAVGIVVSCVGGGSARADQFQIGDERAGAYIRYIKIAVDGHTYYTDSLGRVAIIDLPPGTYHAEIVYKGSRHSFPIVIDNKSKRLKHIPIDAP